MAHILWCVACGRGQEQARRWSDPFMTWATMKDTELQLGLSQHPT